MRCIAMRWERERFSVEEAEFWASFLVGRFLQHTQDAPLISSYKNTIFRPFFSILTNRTKKPSFYVHLKCLNRFCFLFCRYEEITAEHTAGWGLCWWRPWPLCIRFYDKTFIITFCVWTNLMCYTLFKCVWRYRGNKLIVQEKKNDTKKTGQYSDNKCTRVFFLESKFLILFTNQQILFFI